MTTSQPPLGKADRPTDPAVHPREKRAPGARGLVAGILLFLAASAALVAGGWGMLASLSAEPLPARIGEPVAAPGGLVLVDQVVPEHMAPMQMDKFAASGMSMSGMVPDMTPEGQRRFIVEVTLAGREGGLRYSAKDFRLTGEGMEETGPFRHKLESGTVPAGSAVSGSLVFQVPEKAKDLMLAFDGGRQVALDLPPAAHSHSHGGHHSKGGNSHDHDH